MKIAFFFSPSLFFLTEDEQREKSVSHHTVQQLIVEKEQALADLNSVEKSLADLFRRYEKMKEVLEGFRKVSRVQFSFKGQSWAGLGSAARQRACLPFQSNLMNHTSLLCARGRMWMLLCAFFLAWKKRWFGTRVTCSHLWHCDVNRCHRTAGPEHMSGLPSGLLLQPRTWIPQVRGGVYSVWYTVILRWGITAMCWMQTEELWKLFALSNVGSDGICVGVSMLDCIES